MAEPAPAVRFEEELERAPEPELAGIELGCDGTQLRIESHARALPDDLFDGFERFRRARNVRSAPRVTHPLFAEPLGVLAHSPGLRFPGTLGLVTLALVDDEMRGPGDRRHAPALRTPAELEPQAPRRSRETHELPIELLDAFM